jgi:proprotein convertase subtilisin/kexin type 5
VNCDTIIGYVLINGQCVELCGDGIKIYAACDDKNTNDGDGCSSSCQIEKGFFCESNTVANMGDICYRSNATLAI